ncbi:MAG: hypothetical protein VR64_06820 [Desulfatitalea sp. BRH_c12]|nr:MAG: hypothetical protein VR64_06820 [Desulfatitalea sp. BRH_c12]
MGCQGRPHPAALQVLSAALKGCRAGETCFAQVKVSDGFAGGDRENLEWSGDAGDIHVFAWMFMIRV